MVDVPVLKSFTHEGRAVRRGQTITVTPIDAAVLARRGFVSLSRLVKQPVPRKGQTYRRRDMTPEP